MKRMLYLLAVFTGVRAMFNRVHGLFLPGLRVAKLDGEVVQFDEYGPVRIRVNARPAPGILESEANVGMISLSLVSPGISRLLYALLRLTSHFGCGHVEIAFYEEQGRVTCFAIRNIVRSNMDRLRVGGYLDGLKFSRDHDEVVLLKRVLCELESAGFKTAFASPDKCVSLAVNPALICNGQRSRATETLRRKYRRIGKKLDADRNLLNTSNSHLSKLSCQLDAT